MSNIGRVRIWGIPSPLTIRPHGTSSDANTEHGNPYFRNSATCLCVEFSLHPHQAKRPRQLFRRDGTEASKSRPPFVIAYTEPAVPSAVVLLETFSDPSFRPPFASNAEPLIRIAV